jgi:hypothetical protein
MTAGLVRLLEPANVALAEEDVETARSTAIMGGNA